MQCVILAAGEGKRLRPLTEQKPKPLVEVGGKTILDHIVEALPSVIDELVLVVGYRADQIRAHCGDRFHSRRVQYVTQKNPATGTGEALLCAKKLISGKFLLMYADDIHGSEALHRVVQEAHGMIGVYSQTPERFGVLMQNDDGTLRQIIEKPSNPTSNLVNVGGFVVDRSILAYRPTCSDSGEILVTDMLTEYAKRQPVRIIEQKLWIPVGYPEDVERAEVILKGLK